MTDREKIIAEIERLKKWEPIDIKQEQIRKLVQRARLGVLIGLKDFITSLPVEQPSEEFEGLEDSIIEYLGHVPENEPEHSETLYTYEQMQEIARHFAQWQKEQMMNEACQWLQHNAEKYVASYGFHSYQTGLLLHDFKHAMEDNQ